VTAMPSRQRKLAALGWVVAGLSLFAYAGAFWHALRRALLPRVHVDGTAVPAGVASDGAGGAIAAFTATGATDVGCGEPFDDRGLVLARFDSSGKCAWKKPVKGAAAVDVATSGAGDVFLVADVYDNADFGFGPTPSFSSLAVASYDSAGKARWSRSLDAHVAEVPAQRSRQVVAVSGDGAMVVVLVATHNFADLGNGKITTRNTAHDAVVVALDGATGKTRWTHYVGPVSFGGLTFGKGGEVIVTGSFVGDADLGAGPWRAADAGNGEVFVVELDVHGDTKLAVRFGTGDATFVATSRGHVFVAGSYGRAGPDFGGALPSCGGEACTFVAELDADAKPVHRAAIAGAKPRGLGVDPDGAVFLAGDRDRDGPLLGRVDSHGLFGSSPAQIHGLDQVDGLAFDTAGRAVVVGRSTGGVHVGAGVRWVLP
jgi:hypothetical protein